MIPFVDFKRQVRSLEKEIEESLRAVFARGQFILGEELAAFEREFARFCGVRYAVGVASGTEAIQLALMACGVGPGDEVITVPHTAVPTVTALSAAGATPVFVDIDPESMTLDPAQLEGKITPKTKAFVPVHLYGHPADMKAILKIARQHRLAVIEDACQAHGAQIDSRRVGSFGEAGCFSFYPTKNLGGYGDGGIITTNREDLAQKLRQLRNYGQVDRYVHAHKGINSRLDEIQAAILRLKLKYLDRWNQERREKVRLYGKLLAQTPLQLPKEKNGSRSVFHLYVVRSPKRDKLKRHLEKKKIGCLIHYPIPVHLQKSYQELGYKKGDLPVTEQTAQEVLSLPLYPELTEAEIKKVAEAVREILA